MSMLPPDWESPQPLVPEDKNIEINYNYDLLNEPSRRTAMAKTASKSSEKSIQKKILDGFLNGFMNNGEDFMAMTPKGAAKNPAALGPCNVFRIDYP